MPALLAGPGTLLHLPARPPACHTPSWKHLRRRLWQTFPSFHACLPPCRPAPLSVQVMVLDTLERLEGANRLYRRLGFELTERYNDCPLPGVLYFARMLESEGKAGPPAQQLGGSSNGGGSSGTLK